MGDRPRILPFGERALLWEVGTMDAAHRAWSSLDERRPAGLVDVVVGAETLLLLFDDGGGIDETRELLLRMGAGGRPEGARSHSIPVVYDGEDLDEVARMVGTTPAEVVRLHTTPTYTVGFLGFSPGFAYLFGGDDRLRVPRLSTPRTSVTAGSVALAGAMTAIYPQSTPGGWRLIGRTNAVMFDPSRARPALLSPADQVRFEPVSELPAGAPPGLTVAVPPPAPGAPWLRILDPGPLLTIQDEGRAGWAHAGVPMAGAADRASSRRANELVGNGLGAAVLESVMGRCRIRLGARRTVAVTGAAADVAVDGIPARAHTALPLPAGAELSIGPTRAGLRVYVAVAGGLDTPVVLGSRSTDTLSGLGPEPLTAGTLVGLGPPPSRTVNGRIPTAATRLAAGDGVLELEARWGPRADRLSASGRETLSGAEFAVGASSDRTGARLDGPPVGVAGEAQLPSEGMVAGAVQVPPGGLPIVLLRNHPPTGGYPAVAVVDERGVDELAQASPGTRVRFRFNPARTPGPRTG